VFCRLPPLVSTSHCALQGQACPAGHPAKLSILDLPPARALPPGCGSRQRPPSFACADAAAELWNASQCHASPPPESAKTAGTGRHALPGPGRAAGGTQVTQPSLPCCPPPLPPRNLSDSTPCWPPPHPLAADAQQLAPPWSATGRWGCWPSAVALSPTPARWSPGSIPMPAKSGDLLARGAGLAYFPC